jgi:hypothetical protein
MGFFESCKTFVLYFSTLVPSPFLSDLDQRPLLSDRLQSSLDNALKHHHYPTFPAPNGPETGDKFICEYPALGDSWKGCSKSDNRTCWLKGPYGQSFTINTDYENFYPEGITREVCATRRLNALVNFNSTIWK